MLIAVGAYFASQNDQVAVAATVAAVLGSLMVSYTRARAEALGVECKVGLATRPVRVVILSIGLVFAKGASLGHFELLAPAVYVLAGADGADDPPAHLHVRRQLKAVAAADRCNERAAAEYLKWLRGEPRATSFEKGSLDSEHHQRFHQRRRRATSTDKVRVAIIGVGNCASSFVQGVQYYRDADPRESVPGLMHVDLGGYHVRDIEFCAAFDIDADKVGKDLSEAIFAGQNNTLKFAGQGPDARRRRSSAA